MQDIYNKLKAPLERDAYKIDYSRGKQNPMTTIGAQYIIDRLNIVLGLGRWEHTGKYEVSRDEEGKIRDVIFFGVLSGTITEYSEKETIIREFRIEGVGYCEQQFHKEKGYAIKLAGDILKSAKTDSLSKCSSWLGIGDDVFKGKVAPGTAPKPQPVIDPAKNQLVGQIKNLCVKVMGDKSPEEKQRFIKIDLEVNSFDDLYNKELSFLENKKAALEAILKLVSK